MIERLTDVGVRRPDCCEDGRSSAHEGEVFLPGHAILSSSITITFTSWAQKAISEMHCTSARLNTLRSSDSRKLRVRARNRLSLLTNRIVEDGVPAPLDAQRVHLRYGPSYATTNLASELRS